VALVIGNSKYPIGQLTNPKNDAEDVAAVLERLNFEVLKHKDLTVAGFDKALFTLTVAFHASAARRHR
jgi:uncharacterized caspase-like protein